LPESETQRVFDRSKEEKTMTCTLTITLTAALALAIIIAVGSNQGQLAVAADALEERDPTVMRQTPLFTSRITGEMPIHKPDDPGGLRNERQMGAIPGPNRTSSPDISNLPPPTPGVNLPSPIEPPDETVLPAISSDVVHSYTIEPPNNWIGIRNAVGSFLDDSALQLDSETGDVSVHEEAEDFYTVLIKGLRDPFESTSEEAEVEFKVVIQRHVRQVVIIAGCQVRKVLILWGKTNRGDWFPCLDEEGREDDLRALSSALARHIVERDNTP
jgi:hypothetical protein